VRDHPVAWRARTPGTVFYTIGDPALDGPRRRALLTAAVQAGCTVGLDAAQQRDETDEGEVAAGEGALAAAVPGAVAAADTGAAEAADAGDAPAEAEAE